MRNPFNFLLILLFLSVGSCVTPFDTGVTQNTPQLIVDGLITDQAGPYTVKLTYSAAYSNGSEGINLLVSGARVSITDDLGGSHELREAQLGTYRTDAAAIRGTVGRSYQLHIQTADSEAYESKPELLKNVSPIDSIYWEYTEGSSAKENGFHVYLDTKDLPTTGDFYRWRWTHYETPYFCDERSTSPSTTVYGYSCCVQCWDITRCYGCVTIASDVNVNGNRIIKQPILVAPFDRIDKYYAEIEQLSLTREAYQFWKAAKEQSSSSGGPFDTPPAPVPGNITNLTHPENGALGFFGASGLVVKPYWIDRTKTIGSLVSKPIPPVPPGLPPCAPCLESNIRTPVKPRFWDR